MLRFCAPFLALGLALFSPLDARAADVIGLVLPLQGRLEPVAKRMEFGALAALEKARKDNPDLRLTLIPNGCDEETVPEQAKALRDAEVDIVVGPVCFGHAAALAKALNTPGSTQRRVPVVVTGARNKGLKRLREVDDLPLFSLSTRSNAEASAVVAQILPRFGGKPFAIIDDGSVYGRGLSDSIRLLGEQAGLKATQTLNFRPLQSNQVSLVRRLTQSGVEAIFIAASAPDVVTITSDIQTLGLNWIIATGEQAIMLPFTENAQRVPKGLLMVRESLPDTIVNLDAFTPLKGDDDTPSQDLLLGHVLVEIAVQSLASESNTLIGQTFDTTLGAINFDNDGRAAPLQMKLYEWDGGSFKPVTQAEKEN